MNNLNYYYLVLFVITILIILELNTNYSVKKQPLLDNLINKKGTLQVCTHDYEHKDIFIVLKELKYNSLMTNKNYIMIFANKIWNKLLEPLRPNNVEFMYTKENTTNKISAKLLLGYNVIIYLYRENPAKGIYYILKNTNSPLILLKIKGNKKGTNHYSDNILNIYIQNSLTKFMISYSKCRYGDLTSTNPECFMKQLKNKLY